MSQSDRINIKNRTLNHRMTHRNILKYYRVTIFWAKKKTGLGQADLDMLFFIYDIPLFTRTDFQEFKKMVPWSYGKFKKLLEDGWIMKYRDKGPNQAPLYRISPQGKRLITSFYKKLSGEEPFSENVRKNPVMGGERSSEIIMARKMKEINKKNRGKALKLEHVPPYG